MARGLIHKARYVIWHPTPRYQLTDKKGCGHAGSRGGHFWLTPRMAFCDVSLDATICCLMSSGDQSLWRPYHEGDSPERIRRLHVYAEIHAHTHTHTHICIHIYIYIYVYICTHNIHVRKPPNLQSHSHAYTNTCTYIYVYTCLTTHAL